jgi:hypothetical protein
VLVCTLLAGGLARAEGWQAGTARAVITPRESIWMAGYGSRDHPSEGTLHDLWAKALALRDPSGKAAVLITLDVCGIGRSLSNEIRDRLKEAHGLERSQIVLACSHTHTGPVVGTNLITMYPLDEEQTARVERYARTFRDAVIAVAGRALETLAPAALSWEIGRCDFAVNRRNNDQAKAAELRERIALEGPVDHDVPVLKVAGPNGELRAVVCQYACHCTVLPIYQFTGDYAGFAQIALERDHPGAQAMFVAGCGADQNPLPRGTIEHAQRYGEQLAASVERVLAGPLRPIDGGLRWSYQEIDLAFAAIPSRAHWEEEAKSTKLADANRARMLLKRLDDRGTLEATYPYPVQLWRLGDDLSWFFLGGEVTVDYALRIKRNLGSSRTWVAGYCNDVMAYIPSLRVLKEGGYEGGGAMVYYGQPAPWSERVEEQIIDAVRGAAETTRP